MARIFITGSADGLGRLAAKALIGQGHRVMLHARNEERGRQALEGLPGAEGVLTGDLSGMAETRALALSANDTGAFDAVIHNAGVYRAPDTLSADGLPVLLAVNTLAPYILTCLMHRPGRLIYLSSDMHLQGRFRPEHLHGGADSRGRITYADTKLHALILSMAVAGKWTGVYANAVNPGWVPTKMGGPGAPDDLDKGYETQAWLAVSKDADAQVSGRYLHHKRPARYLPAAADSSVQEALLAACGRLTGVPFR